MSIIIQITKPLTFILLALLLVNPVLAGELKPTMKEMRLHFKHAIDADTPEKFNEKVKLFLIELQTARNFKFSPERAKLSLEGLNKVHAKVSTLAIATEANLATLQEELKQVDLLRKEYHKKVKPGGFDLLLQFVKDIF